MKQVSNYKKRSFAPTFMNSKSFITRNLLPNLIIWSDKIFDHPIRNKPWNSIIDEGILGFCVTKTFFYKYNLVI